MKDTQNSGDLFFRPDPVPLIEACLCPICPQAVLIGLQVTVGAKGQAFLEVPGSLGVGSALDHVKEEIAVASRSILLKPMLQSQLQATLQLVLVLRPGPLPTLPSPSR